MATTNANANETNVANNASSSSKIIVDDDPFIIDIIRNKEMAASVSVEDVINFEKVVFPAVVGTLHEHPVQDEDILVYDTNLIETYSENQRSNIPNMCIAGP